MRPQFEAAPAPAREIKTHSPRCRVTLAVYEMKRLGPEAAELTALANHSTAHSLVSEMPTGPRAKAAGAHPDEAAERTTTADNVVEWRPSWTIGGEVVGPRLVVFVSVFARKPSRAAVSGTTWPAAACSFKWSIIRAVLTAVKSSTPPRSGHL
ncbi:hypothetical protein [Embleya sp. NBC_00888]|uniref:hypothetical protein n=1 Tax=Embleya sp. NBC_00888 TaxID=2975960 RepID=UPI002F913918